MVTFLEMKSSKGESGRGAGQSRGTGRKAEAQASPFEPHTPGGRPDDADAFFPDPGDGPARAPEDVAETLAEEFVQAATTGEDADEDELDASFPEEIGGPFIETGPAEELAEGADEANPTDAEREPLPRPVAGLVDDPTVDEQLDAADPEDGGDAALPEAPDPEPGVDALNETPRGGRRTS